MALEKVAEEGDVLVADGVADFLHRAMVAFQQTFGGGDSQLLQVHERAISGGLLEAADEIAQAHAHAARRSIEGEVLVKVVVQPFLRAGDAVVGVIRF